MPNNDKVSMRYSVIFRPLLLLAAVSTFAAVASENPTEIKSRDQYVKLDDTRNVLVLLSFNRGYGWTDSVMEGVESVMQAAPENIELWVEYLDASRLQSASFARQLRTFTKEISILRAQPQVK